MNQQDKEILIERWLDGKITEEELLESISSEELSQYKTILNTVDNWEPQGSEKEAISLAEILAIKKEAKVVSINRTPWIISIAASIALIAIVSLIFFKNGETIYFAEEENLEIVLPDETTTVILSKGARLSYQDFDIENRRVEIEGRVYFDVAEKGPFEVKYYKGNISVLGTQFEIVQFDDFFEASCFEGKVRVGYQDKKAVIVPGESVSYIDGELPKIQVRQYKPSWIQGQEKFENDALSKVIEIIEIHYEITINTDSIDTERRFTGILPIDDLEAACKTVFAPLGMKYRIEDKTIILTE